MGVGDMRMPTVWAHFVPVGAGCAYFYFLEDAYEKGCYYYGK